MWTLDMRIHQGSFCSCGTMVVDLDSEMLSTKDGGEGLVAACRMEGVEEDSGKRCF